MLGTASIVAVFANMSDSFGVTGTFPVLGRVVKSDHRTDQ